MIKSSVRLGAMEHRVDYSGTKRFYLRQLGPQPAKMANDASRFINSLSNQRAARMKMANDPVIYHFLVVIYGFWAVIYHFLTVLDHFLTIIYHYFAVRRHF